MAKRKIIISEYDNIAALMEDDRAVEFIIHRGDMLLGDVYLATVENILPSIDAAFVNVGGDKMGFLHSSDVPGKGDLKDRLEPKQQLVVQIMKEPTGHKGPRVSTNISLPGRFLVMMPESKGISISRKIVEQSERSRLKSVVSLIKPPGVGVIIRTEAAHQKDSDITEDFETLLERWQNIVSMADTATPPTLLYRDQDLLYRVIREAVTEDVTEIVVDSAFGQQRAQQLLQNWNMDKGVKVTHYQGNQSILVGTGVDKEIKLALQTKVPLPSGGYLYIQPTEALTVVDVNSGKFTSLQSQAETIKLTNLEACKEIARQLRLRNVGGMIIVDFIDMESRANQLAVLQTFENELAPDKAKPQIGQLSDLGLVEMTRHRQGQSLSEIFTRRCTVCNGTGHALEEFSWMQMGGDTERSRPGRSKLPVRQPHRHQQVPKPAASLNRGRPRVVGQLAEATPSEAVAKEKATNVTPGNILLSSLAGKKQEADNLVEYFNDKIYKAMGARFSQAAKFSWIPIPVNSVLSRINPKANDIVTLVRSIEAAASMPMPVPSLMEDDFDGEEDGEEAEAAEAVVAEVPEVRVVPANINGKIQAIDKTAPEEAAPEPLNLEVPEEEIETDEVEAAVAIKPRRGRPPRKTEEPAPVVEAPEVFQPDEEEEPVEPIPEFIADDSAETPDEEDAEGENVEPVAINAATPPKRRGGRPQKRSVKKSSSKR